MHWTGCSFTNQAHRIALRSACVHRPPWLLGAIATILLTAVLGGRLFGPAGGMMAAALLATSFLLSFESRVATVDATLLAVILLAQNALSAVYLGRDSASLPSRLTTSLFW